MSKDPKVIFQVREFLNEDLGSPAHIIAEVSEDGGTAFRVADCSRAVHLDFDLNYLNEEEVRAVLRKMARFSKIVVGFEKALWVAAKNRIKVVAAEKKKPAKMTVRVPGT